MFCTFLTWNFKSSCSKRFNESIFTTILGEETCCQVSLNILMYFHGTSIYFIFYFFKVFTLVQQKGLILRYLKYCRPVFIFQC